MKSRFFNKLITLTLVFSALFFSSRLYFRLTDDFRIANITHDLPFNPAWEPDALTQTDLKPIQSLLSQSYSYLGKGAQSYVFESDDGKVVLKFFKFKHLKAHPLTRILSRLPFLKSWGEAKSARKKRLVESVFSGYKLAFDSHREETGLLYIHLNQTTHLNHQITVIDKLGCTRSIDLDATFFVLQEKAETTRQLFKDALARHDLDLVKKRLKQIFSLYVSEYQKGMYDRDHGVMHNTGFVGEKPIHYDIGKLTKDPSMKEKDVYKKDLIQVAHKFKVWLWVNYPQEYPDLLAFIEETLTDMFETPFSFETCHVAFRPIHAGDL